MRPQWGQILGVGLLVALAIGCMLLLSWYL